MPPSEASKEVGASAPASVFVPPTGVDFWIDSNDTEKLIENGVRQWMAWCPEEAKAFVRQQDEVREKLRGELGMNKSESMRRFIEVPRTLYRIISKLLGTTQWTFNRADKNNEMTKEVKLLIKHCPAVLVAKPGEKRNRVTV